ncbi:CAD protein [Frankliniella fusca]|uniref:CAD protein n=1 Tax=Frankliniella fusca TaxID=407009 RepID=A0AAE1HBM7_9NEOP|nr:CAD protein [Frankliniella fusca]
MLVGCSITWVQYLMESEVDARAREAAENTVEHLLEMLHDGRITFEDMKAAAQRDEAIFFNRPDFSDKYFAHRDSYIEERKLYNQKILQRIQHQEMEGLIEQLTVICAGLLEELDWVIGEINAVHKRRRRLEKMN